MRNSHSLLLRSIVLATAMAAASGCIKSNLQVRVNPDGSGEIMLSRMFAREIVAMYDQQRRAMQQSGQMHGEMGMPDDPFFNEKQLSKLARKLGANVTLVKAQKLDHPAGRGYCALYAFKNVSDLCINPESIMSDKSMLFSRGMDMDDDTDEIGTPANMAIGMDPDEAKKSIQFQFTKGAPDKLRVIMPASENEGDMPEIPDESDDEANKDEEPNPFVGDERNYGRAGGGMYGNIAVAMMKNEGSGMTMDISVEVVGTLVQSTASHPDTNVKNRITLLSLDSNKLMSSPKFSGKKRMALVYGYQSPGHLLNMAQGQPGFVREAKPEIEIQFQ